MKPQYFDILGIIAFPYITVFALYFLTHGGQVPIWSVVVLAVIGIVGFLVDSMIVLYYFLLKK